LAKNLANVAAKETRHKHQHMRMSMFDDAALPENVCALKVKKTLLVVATLKGGDRQ
jgi:hypothetical protein